MGGDGGALNEDRTEVVVEAVCSIQGMTKNRYVVPSDAPGFGMDIADELVVAWYHGAAMRGLG